MNLIGTWQIVAVRNQTGEPHTGSPVGETVRFEDNGRYYFQSMGREFGARYGTNPEPPLLWLNVPHGLWDVSADPDDPDQALFTSLQTGWIQTMRRIP